MGRGWPPDTSATPSEAGVTRPIAVHSIPAARQAFVTVSESPDATVINSEPDAKLREARLAMISGFRVILKDALGLLGIQALEEI